MRHGPSVIPGLSGNDAFGKKKQPGTALIGSVNQLSDNRKIRAAFRLHEKLPECDT